MKFLLDLWTNSKISWGRVGLMLLCFHSKVKRGNSDNGKSMDGCFLELAGCISAWWGRRGVNGGQNHWVTPSLILWWCHEAFCQSLEVLFYWKLCSWKSPCRAVRSWDFIWLNYRGWWSCILSLEPYLLYCPSLTDAKNFTLLNRIQGWNICICIT